MSTIHCLKERQLEPNLPINLLSAVIFLPFCIFQGAWNTAYGWSLEAVLSMITWVNKNEPNTTIQIISFIGQIQCMFLLFESRQSSKIISIVSMQLDPSFPGQLFFFFQIQSTLPSSMLPSSISSSPPLPSSANPAILTAPHHTEVAGYSEEKVWSWMMALSPSSSPFEGDEAAELLQIDDFRYAQCRETGSEKGGRHYSCQVRSWMIIMVMGIIMIIMILLSWWHRLGKFGGNDL